MMRLLERTWLTLIALFFITSASAAERLTLLEGQEATGQIASIDPTGKLTGTGLPEGLTLDSIRKLERDLPESASGRPAVVLELVGGGRIHASSVTVASEKFTVKWPHGEDLVLPIDVVRAVRLKPDTKDDNFDAALTKPVDGTDRLFVEIDGKATLVEGLVESLAADKVVFELNGEKQSLPTEKLFGIVMAQIGAASKSASGVTVELSDGARIAGVVDSLKDDKLALTVGASSKVSVPWSAVRSVAVRSSRLAFLSDLEPTKVNEQRLVTLPASWQRDKNVNKKTLMLGERKFDRGLGVHAYSELVFDNGGEFDVFAAVIGLDAAAERKGDCVFVVLGDGRELLRERRAGADEPKEIKIDIKGVKELSLVVEPGEGLDLADLADWADARVIKQK